MAKRRSVRRLSTEEAAAFLDEWAAEQTEIFAARRVIEQDPRAKEYLYRLARHGARMRRPASRVDDAKLLDVWAAVQRDFPALKRREQYRRAGVAVGLSWSYVRDRLLRIQRARPAIADE